VGCRWCQPTSCYHCWARHIARRIFFGILFLLSSDFLKRHSLDEFSSHSSHSLNSCHVMSLHVMSLHVISRRVIHIIIFLISFITSFILFMSFQFVWLACPFNSLTRSPIWGAGFLSPALRSHSCPTSQCRLQNHKYYIPSFWSPWQEGNYKVGAYGCIWNFMFPAHDVHISGVLGKVYWTPATNSKPQTKLHHSNDYR
jgi:hypothetical protein